MSFMICTLPQYCAGNKIKKSEIGDTSSMYGGTKGMKGFWRGNLRERDHWGDTGVEGRVVLRWIFR
jgi:hypothetical protein